MKTTLNGKPIKVYFQGTGTTKNIINVKEIELVGNIMTVTTVDSKVKLINFNNVNLVEETD